MKGELWRNAPGVCLAREGIIQSDSQPPIERALPDQPQISTHQFPAKHWRKMRTNTAAASDPAPHARGLLVS